MSEPSTPSASASSPSLSSIDTPSPPSTPPNLHQNTIDPDARWVVQKYGGTSVGKFAAQIAENIVPYAQTFFLLYPHLPTYLRRNTQRPFGSMQARHCLLRAFRLHQVVRHHQPPLARSIRSPSTRSAGQVPCAIWGSDTRHNFFRLPVLPHGLPTRRC